MSFAFRKRDKIPKTPLVFNTSKHHSRRMVQKQRMSDSIYLGVARLGYTISTDLPSYSFLPAVWLCQHLRWTGSIPERQRIWRKEKDISRHSSANKPKHRCKSSIYGTMGHSSKAHSHHSKWNLRNFTPGRSIASRFQTYQRAFPEESKGR